MGTTERQHQCKECGKTFFGRKRKFCNDPCSRTMYSLTCEVCQKPFKSANASRKVCSIECTAIGNRSLPDCKCRWCGSPFRMGHGTKRSGKFCSREHAWRNMRLEGIVSNLQTRFTDRVNLLASGRQRCQRCNTFGVGQSRYCEPCRDAVKRESLKYPLGNVTCECGREFNRTHHLRVRCEYCQSQRHRQTNAAAKKAAKARRRARIKTTRVESVSPQEIFDRDGWMCGICGEEVLAGAQVPHPQAATIDHIVPLAKGGTHTADNLQCAHFICNCKKADYMPERQASTECVAM